MTTSPVVVVVVILVIVVIVVIAVHVVVAVVVAVENRQEPPRDHRSPRFIRTSAFSVAWVILFQCTSEALSRHRRSGQQAFLPSSWLYNH